MSNDTLRELFHDLFGAINGISLMSQMCTQFITIIEEEGLNNKIKDELITNFKNVGLYYNRAIKDLESVTHALTKIGSVNIGTALKASIICELGRIKDIINTVGNSFDNILETDTKEDLLRFARELGKMEPICRSMAETVRFSKKKLSEQGKY